MSCSFEQRGVPYRLAARARYASLFSTRGKGGGRAGETGQLSGLGPALRPSEGRAAAAKMRLDKKPKPEYASELKGFSKHGKMLGMRYTFLKRVDIRVIVDAQ